VPHEKNTKWILISALVAAVLEACLLFAAHQPSNGPTIFTLFSVPFFMLASACGGSLGEIVFYLSIFYIFFVVTFLAHLAWTVIANDNHDT